LAGCRIETPPALVIIAPPFRWMNGGLYLPSVPHAPCDPMRRFYCGHQQRAEHNQPSHAACFASMTGSTWLDSGLKHGSFVI
jgi:hypothetical protein